MHYKFLFAVTFTSTILAAPFPEIRDVSTAQAFSGITCDGDAGNAINCDGTCHRFTGRHSLAITGMVGGTVQYFTDSACSQGATVNNFNSDGCYHVNTGGPVNSFQCTRAGLSTGGGSTGPNTDPNFMNEGDISQQLLDEHNKGRALHGVPDLTWSHDMAQKAHDLTTDCDMHHTSAGENLWKGTAGAYSLASMVDTWYNEVTLYDWSKPGFSEATGHFTQVVWSTTQQVGCAIRNCGGDSYLKCEYHPAGNYLGQFDNVHVPLPVSGTVTKL